MATSGNTSCTLNTNGTDRVRPTVAPARPSVSGGDMASTTSGDGRAMTPSTVVNAVNPPKATARARILRLSVGNGWTRVIEPHAVSWRRVSCPSQPGSRA